MTSVNNYYTSQIIWKIGKLQTKGYTWMPHLTTHPSLHSVEKLLLKQMYMECDVGNYRCLYIAE